MTTLSPRTKTPTPINRTSVRGLGKEMERVLQELFDRHGLIVSVGRLTYVGGSEFRTKVTVVQPAAEPNQYVVGDHWKYANRVWQITAINGDAVTVQQIRPRRPKALGTYTTHKSDLSLGIKLNRS